MPPLNYSEQKICSCSKKWSRFEKVGTVFSTSSCNNVKLFLLKISVTVTKAALAGVNVYDEFYNDSELADFKMSTDGRAYVTFHKLVLSASSEVFKAMFKGDWRNCGEGRIEAEGATISTLNYLKSYIYKGILPENGLRPLLLISERYLIKDLKNDCIKKIAETVTSKNLYTVLELACHHNIPKLAWAVLARTPNSIVHAVYESRKNKRLLETSW